MKFRLRLPRNAARPVEVWTRNPVRAKRFSGAPHAQTRPSTRMSTPLKIYWPQGLRSPPAENLRRPRVLQRRRNRNQQETARNYCSNPTTPLPRREPVASPDLSWEERRFIRSSCSSIADTEATLRRIWDDLSAADLPSRIPAGRPHVTLAVAERIEPDVDALLRPVAQRLPLGCTVGAPLLFGKSNAILARLDRAVGRSARIARRGAPNLRAASCCRNRCRTACPASGRRTSRWPVESEGAQLGPVLRLAGQPSEIYGNLAGLRRWDGSERVEYPIR